jgi:hypothetical protein
MPYSAKSPRISLTSALRAVTSHSRTRWSAWLSCYAMACMGTKRILGRVIASAMASASRLAFLFDLT